MDADDHLEILAAVDDRDPRLGPLPPPPPTAVKAKPRSATTIRFAGRRLTIPEFCRLMAAPSVRLYGELRQLPEDPTEAEVYGAMVRAAGPSGESRRNFGRHVRLKIIRMFGQTCLYCENVGDRLTGPDGKSWHLDHFVPIAAGGADRPDNLVLACQRCNLKKSDRLPRVFLPGEIARLEARKLAAHSGVRWASKWAA